MTLQLSVDELLAKARELAGVDIVDDEVVEPLTVLHRALGKDRAQLDREGARAFEQKLLRLLANRLRMKRDFRRHPEIAEEQIQGPLIIMGTARSGTTKLQKALAASGDFNFLTFWQAFNWASVSGVPNEPTEERIAEAEAFCRWFDERSPETKLGHSFEALEPEEEGVLTEGCLVTPTFVGFAELPGYGMWLGQQSPTIEFEFLRDAMKYLQWQGLASAERPWLLKSPSYSSLELEILQVFPGARFVMAHRSPLRTVPSMCKLVGLFRQAYGTSKPDPMVLLEHNAASVEAQAEIRRTHPDLPMLDVLFEDVVEDLEAVLERVYAHAGMTLSAEARQNVLSWDRTHAMHELGKFEYSLEEFGLDEAVIRNRMASYLELLQRLAVGRGLRRSTPSEGAPSQSVALDVVAIYGAARMAPASMFPRLLHDGVIRAAGRAGDQVALRAGDQAWTWADLDRLSSALAASLARRGVAAGDRVAIMMSNRPEFVVAVHAISRLGAAAVLVSPAWKAREVEHAVALTGPVHGVADGAAPSVLSGCLGEGAVIDVDHPPLLEELVRSPSGAPPAPTISDDDEALLVFSSGTTGMPKAVRHSHRSLAYGTEHWVRALALGEDDRFQVATPPSHILGLLNLLAAASAGATVRLHRRFDLDEVLRCIESDRLTLEMAVAPIALAMANHPDIERYDLSSLRFILWGATPVTPSVAERVTERTGVRWLQGYGASEVPVIACNPIDQPDRWRLDSAGLPPAGVELRVVDLDGGAVLEPGEVGEIQVRSPSAMLGYLPDEASADAFVDGWYRTGDVGWMESEGWIHLTDRSKEMIKVKGFQVAPAEIESVLHGHPSVLDCAVFGIPDEEAGEVPVAAVQLDPRRPVTEHELEDLVADSLATYKRLRRVVVVDSVPRLPSGKVLRRELREAWMSRNREM